jgi:hypothetical protein
MTPKTRYTRSGDVNIAYQVFGQGPRDLVVVFGWFSNVEVMWEEPMLARFLNRLASCARVIIFGSSKSSCCQLENSRRASNPPPSRLASVSVARTALASCWAMARPSPVPPVSRLREASIR